MSMKEDLIFNNVICSWRQFWISQDWIVWPCYNIESSKLLEPWTWNEMLIKPCHYFAALVADHILSCCWLIGKGLHPQSNTNRIMTELIAHNVISQLALRLYKDSSDKLRSRLPYLCCASPVRRFVNHLSIVSSSFIFCRRYGDLIGVA